MGKKNYTRPDMVLRLVKPIYIGEYPDFIGRRRTDCTSRRRFGFVG